MMFASLTAILACANSIQMDRVITNSFKGETDLFFIQAESISENPRSKYLLIILLFLMSACELLSDLPADSQERTVTESRMDSWISDIQNTFQILSSEDQLKTGNTALTFKLG